MAAPAKRVSAAAGGKLLALGLGATGDDPWFAWRKRWVSQSVQSAKDWMAYGDGLSSWPATLAAYEEARQLVRTVLLEADVEHDDVYEVSARIALHLQDRTFAKIAYSGLCAVVPEEEQPADRGALLKQLRWLGGVVSEKSAEPLDDYGSYLDLWEEYAVRGYGRPVRIRLQTSRHLAARRELAAALVRARGGELGAIEAVVRGYVRGFGVPSDFSRARMWLRQAPEAERDRIWLDAVRPWVVRAMSEASARETRGFWPRREDDLVELNNALVLLRFGDLNGAETRLSWLIFPESFDKLALPLAEAYAKRGQLEQARRVLRVLAMEVEDERVETCLRLEMLFQLCAAYARNGLHEELLAVLHRHDAMLRSTGCRLTRKLTEEYMVDVASVLPFERINTIVDRLAPGKAASRFHVPLAIGASARGDDEAALMHLEKVTDEISVLYTLERMATEQGKRGKLDQAERTLAMAGAGASSALSMMEVWKELRRTGQLEAAQAWLDKAESLARKWLSRRTVSDGDRDDWHLVLIALRDASADMGMPDRELYWTSELRRLLRDKVEDYFWRGVNATDLIDNWRQRDDEHDVVEALALLVRPDSSSRIDFNVLEYAVTTLVAMGRVEEAAAYTDMHPAAARHSKFALTWARQRARAGRWAEARWLAVREPQLRKCEDALQELLREQVWQGDLHAAMTTANHLCIGSGTPSGYSTIARMLVHPLILQDEAPWDARTQELRKGVKFIVK